jgi:hypothetical protein
MNPLQSQSCFDFDLWGPKAKQHFIFGVFLGRQPLEPKI